MAESGEKTEQPTEKKLRDAREKGQVAVSQEVSATATILASFMAVWLMWSYTMETIQQLFELSIDILRYPFIDALKIIISASVDAFVSIAGVIIAITMFAGILGVMVQIGLLISFQSVTPSLNKLNPQNYFKKVFSKKGLIELLKTFIKLGVLGSLFYIVLAEKGILLLEVPVLGKHGILYILGELMLPLVLMTVTAFSIIAIVDFILQKQMHTKELMMSMDEIKREYKESEGDPQIKGQRKQLHQELVMSDAGEKVKKSNVLITNPTHLAIAIYYKAGKTDLPIIYAMGENAIASRMKQIAEEFGVPIMRNVPLARGLFVEGRVNEYIPSEFIEPVAEVLRWVQKIEREKYSY